MKRSVLIHVGWMVAAASIVCARSGAAEPPPTVTVTYFFNPGCRECEEVKDLLRRAGDETGVSLQITSLDLTRDKNIESLWGWEDRTGKKAEGLVALVVGGEFLAGYAEIKERLVPVVIAQAGVAPPPSPVRPSARSVESEFGRFRALAVIGAGFIDGINPCAFAVLVMLLSFLLVGGLSRAQTLRAGLAFSLAVFFTYFLLGLGLFSVLVKSVAYRSVADIVYLAVGALALILGAVSFYDAAVIYRTRELKDSRLRLPPALMNRIQKLISRGFSSRRLVLSAFLLGFLISLLELVCTGQIYLPTIILIMKDDLLRRRALGYLILYCLAFIVPLLIVFASVFWGSRIPKLAEWVRRYNWVSKLLAGAVFLALAAFLFLRF